MKHTLISRLLTGAAFCSGAASALAHNGHGMAGTHWHATDVAGFVLVIVLAALAILLSRGK